MSFEIAVDSPPGMIEPVDVVELLGQANRRGARVERLDRVDVLPKRALQSEYADVHATSLAEP